MLSSVGPDVQNPAASFLPPSLGHLMGTDQYGRSIWARVVYGGRYTIGASLAVVVLGGIVGTALGLVAGYLRGTVGFIIMRAVDLLLAFPGILLALGVTAILGPSLVNAVIAVAIVAVPLYARIVEGAAREVANLPYVRAAKALGAGPGHIIWRHVLPGALPGSHRPDDGVPGHRGAVDRVAGLPRPGRPAAHSGVGADGVRRPGLAVHRLVGGGLPRRVPGRVRGGRQPDR